MSARRFRAETIQGSTTSTASATTVETTLGTTVLYAQGFIDPLALVHVVAWGTVANNANAKTVTFYFGATSQAFTLVTSAAASWYLEAWVARTSSTAQTCSVSCVSGVTASPTAETYTLTPAEAASGDIVCKVTGTGTTTNDVVCKACIFQV